MIFDPWYTIFPILSGNISLGIIFSVLNFILIPHLSKEGPGQWSPGMAFFLGIGLAAFLNPLLGGISDNLGRRNLFTGLLFLISFLSCSLVSLSKGSSIYVWATIFICTAFLISPLYSALVADHSREGRRAQAFGITIGVTTISSFLTSLFINRFFDLHPLRTFRSLSLLILLFSVPLFVWTFLGKNSGSKGSIKVWTISSILESKALWTFFLAQAGGWFSVGGILPYITSFLHNALGITIGQASQWAGIFSLLSGCFSILCGAVTRLIDKKKLFLLSYMVLGLLIGLIPLGLSLKAEAVLVLLTIWNLTLGFFYALGPTILSLLTTEHIRGSAFGLNMVFVMLSQAIAVQLFGLMIPSYSLLFSIAGGVLLFAIIPLRIALHF